MEDLVIWFSKTKRNPIGAYYYQGTPLIIIEQNPKTNELELVCREYGRYIQNPEKCIIRMYDAKDSNRADEMVKKVTAGVNSLYVTTAGFAQNKNVMHVLPMPIDLKRRIEAESIFAKKVLAIPVEEELI